MFKFLRILVSLTVPDGLSRARFHKRAVLKGLLIVSLFASTMSLSAQGTAFTYQGRLNVGGLSASGSYDLTFQLFNVPNSGVGLGPAVTNSATAVSNGLFAVTLDFGAGIFTGSNYWVEISARTNGTGPFATLSPRLPLTPAPYAMYAPSAGSAAVANSVSATNIVGTVPVALLPPSVITNGESAVNISGKFSGNGSGLTNVPQAFVNVLTAGVTNDGVTDVTVPLQNLLNKGGAFYFPAGRYYAQELTITNNTTLYGNAAVLVYANNPQNNNIFVRWMLNTNISISGLAFDGGDYSYFGTRTFNTYLGRQDFSAPDQYFYWNPAGLRHGLQFNSTGGGVISGITIQGFNGIGLLPVAAGDFDTATSVATLVKGVTCFANFTGLFSSGVTGTALGGGTNVALPNWITNYVPGGTDPEFMSYSQLNLFNNTVGLCASAGNCTYVNSHIDANLFGQLDAYGFNEHHGSMSSIIYTHNINAAVYIAGCVHGEQFINCQFRDNQYGTIILNNAQGITIDSCTFAPLSITNESTDGTGQNFLRNNTYSGTWANQSLNTDGHLIYFGNHSYDMARDNDGQPLTLLETGNTSGLTFTNAAGTLFQLQDNSSTNGFNFIPK